MGASERFVDELRRVLHHLYSPAELRKSPLAQIAELCPADKGLNRPSALRRILTDAIQAIKPEASVPPHADAWRIYHTLTWRFVEQSSQEDVAANLAISPRQLRRLEQAAVRELADSMWAHYNLGQARHLEEILQGEDEPYLDGGNNRTGVEPPGREQELEWLKRSLPSEAVDMARVVQAALKTAAPLLEELGVQVACAIPEDLPPMAGQLAPIHQALLNVLTAAARSVPGGQLQIAVQNEPGGLCVHVHALGREGREGIARWLPNGEFTDKLDMARQLIGLLGGTLQVTLSPPPSQPSTPSLPLRRANACVRRTSVRAQGFGANALRSPGQALPPFHPHVLTVTLVLSVARQVPVLMIDDNADTLQLFERYLSQSRYRFIGVRDPGQALDLIEELAPQVVLLDVMLPGVDGWELLGRLREHPRTRAVPVLVCTILPQEQLALTLGAAAFIRKPVSREGLLAALDPLVAPQSRGSR